MPSQKLTPAVGDQVFLAEGAEEIGAVREVARHHLVVYVENANEFMIAADAVKSTHDGKVVLDPSKLDRAFLDAAAKAHTREIE